MKTKTVQEIIDAGDALKALEGGRVWFAGAISELDACGDTVTLRELIAILNRPGIAQDVPLRTAVTRELLAEARDRCRVRSLEIATELAAQFENIKEKIDG